VIDGIEYTFEVIGFGPTPDMLIEEFISQEAQASTTPLWARITQPPSRVSKPGSAVPLAASLGLAGMVSRCRKQ